MQIHKIKVSTTMNVLEDNLSYLDDFKDFNKQLEKDTLSTGDVQNHTTNVKAYMTHWQMADKFDSYARLLKIICLEKLPKYDEFDPIQGGHINFCCNDMWGIVYKKGQETKKHSHLNMFSFTYYVKTSKDSAPIIFSNPGHLKIKPKTGTLLIWRGEYEHYVPKQTTNRPRIVIAGNIDNENKPVARTL
jgi:hypothetical protein|tara:strand:+ start:7321 stop:7887 length:567 start_codon:yes stop_codon:yes gene_type:complete